MLRETVQYVRNRVKGKGKKEKHKILAPPLEEVSEVNERDRFRWFRF